VSLRTRERGSHAGHRGPRSPAQRPSRPGRRQRPPRRPSGRAVAVRLLAAVLAIGVVIAGFTDGWGQEASAEPAAQAFLLAWQQQDYQAAASYTTGRHPVVAAALADAFTQLDATALFLSMGRIVQHGDTAEAHFSASVNLGENGHQWTYNGRFGLRRSGSGWKVEWSPSVINPALGPGERLAVVTTVPPRAPVLDAEGKPLQVPSPVYVAGVRPASLASPAATAAAFAQATGLDATQVLGQIEAAPPRRFLELLTLDPGSYSRLRRGLEEVPGLQVRLTRRRLFSSRASQIVGTVGTEDSSVLRSEGAPYQPGATVGLSGLEAAYQRTLAGTPTTEVVVENSSGKQVSVLRAWQGKPSAPVRTTISEDVQSAATRALGTAPDAAAEIVAVQPSTGKILAVAGRQAPGQQLPPGGALDGHAPAGTAFTIVSTAALLGTGFSANTLVPCTSVTDVGGQVFTDPQGGSSVVGATPFSEDFALGCPTAFAGLSRRLSDSEFRQVARGFGIGADWQLPLPAFSGSVPMASGDGQLAGETIGQGVQVSPLAMALVAAEVASGTWHSPVLVTQPADRSTRQQAPLAPGALRSLRDLMRTAVTSGSAQAADVPGEPVYGQAALIPVKNGRHSVWDSWFVGYQGDLAFAVLESDGSPQVSAPALAASFLTALQGSLAGPQAP